jgi:hypothetical protein
MSRVCVLRCEEKRKEEWNARLKRRREIKKSDGIVNECHSPVVFVLGKNNVESK